MGSIEHDFARLEAGEPAAPAAPAAPPAAPTGPGPILTVTTLLPERDWLTIDGRRYDIARYHDLSLYQHAKFGRVFGRALDLYGDLLSDKADALDEAAIGAIEEELGQTSLDATAMIVRKCPRAVVAQLTVEDRVQVCGAFQRAVTRWRQGLASPPTAGQPTGDPSSTPSPPASAADPAGGSGGPASASSSPPIAASAS